MKRKILSPVVQLLDLVYEEANAGTAHSWERLNHSMSGALRLAIGSGFKFEAGDFSHIINNYRSGYWIGDHERLYTLAVAVENTSAIEAYEQCKARKPIIADNVEIESHSNFTHGGTQRRQRERLCVGASLDWMGESVKVTSFKGDYAVACSYKPRKKGEYSDKINKRYTITRDAVIQQRADMKVRKVLAEKLQPHAEKAVKLLKVKNMKAFYSLPLKKIEAVLKKVTEKDT